VRSNFADRKFFYDILRRLRLARWPEPYDAVSIHAWEQNSQPRVSGWHDTISSSFDARRIDRSSRNYGVRARAR